MLFWLQELPNADYFFTLEKQYTQLNNGQENIELNDTIKEEFDSHKNSAVGNCCF